MCMNVLVEAVASDSGHNFSKPVRSSITLVKGLGVKGDAHLGTTVQHLYDMRKTPDAPNLRQVHLMHAELFDAVATQGIRVGPGQMGENITTRGLDILNLPRGTGLIFPSGAAIDITGLRNPCSKLNAIHPDMLEAVLDRTRRIGRRPYPLSGVMAIVKQGGVVEAGDPIKTILPEGAHEALFPV